MYQKEKKKRNNIKQIQQCQSTKEEDDERRGGRNGSRLAKQLTRRGRQMLGCKRGHYARMREVKRFTTPVACGLGQSSRQQARRGGRCRKSLVDANEGGQGCWRWWKEQGGSIRLTIRGHGMPVVRLVVGKFIICFSQTWTRDERLLSSVGSSLERFASTFTSV